ncbi:MAG: type II secretion system minor pseudopilin GspJ [Gammaproteobacteria bacterium]|nr:type II secretion system minor pseudopilin GspJ [Gammaproteobacteria bacterium]
MQPRPTHSLQAKRSSCRGFTLIELLIAIAVFSVMSVMAYGGLSQIIQNSSHSKLELQRLQSIQRAVLSISRDLTQVIERDIRDEYGNTQPFFAAGNSIDYLLEFTRNGRRNPAGLQRSHLLRVAYQHEDGKLLRLFWPQLDRAQGMEPYESILLEQVTAVELRYRDDAGEWHSTWPPLNAQQAGDNPSRLSAIEFTLELENWGEISRLYQVGG